jgi:hypothetical protein
MDYSLKSLPESATSLRKPLAGGQVLDVVQAGKGDLSDWVELMEVVEALCSKWPAVPIKEHSGYWL